MHIQERRVKIQTRIRRMNRQHINIKNEDDVTQTDNRRGGLPYFGISLNSLQTSRCGQQKFILAAIVDSSIKYCFVAAFKRISIANSMSTCCTSVLRAGKSTCVTSKPETCATAYNYWCTRRNPYFLCFNCRYSKTTTLLLFLKVIG